MDQHAEHCAYVSSQGHTCSRERLADGNLCFWHSPDTAKDGPEIKAELERMAKEGQSMEGFVLRYAHLEDIHLSFGDMSVNLRGADLYRAHLNGAHLFRVNFENANLMKASFLAANLNGSNFVDANFLGANFKQTKLERVEWGEQILHEQQAVAAKKAGKSIEAHRYYEEAEEVYRSLRQAYESRGLFERAGHFFQKEMKMKRFQHPLLSMRRFYSKLVDIFSGYGELPSRVVVFSLTVIILCAILYYAFGIVGPDGYIGYDVNESFFNNLRSFANCIYFSIVTFTTLGYGDITPLGAMRAVSAIQAFTGSFTIALFVVVFVKKMTR